VFWCCVVISKLVIVVTHIIINIVGCKVLTAPCYCTHLLFTNSSRKYCMTCTIPTAYSYKQLQQLIRAPHALIRAAPRTAHTTAPFPSTEESCRLKFTSVIQARDECTRHYTSRSSRKTPPLQPEQRGTDWQPAPWGRCATQPRYRQHRQRVWPGASPGMHRSWAEYASGLLVPCGITNKGV
jgi:hypothetical protein